jgi:alkylhydroperoxidase family enzyme
MSPEKLSAVAAWYDSELFSDAERAALALTEVATRPASRGDGVRVRAPGAGAPGG